MFGALLLITLVVTEVLSNLSLISLDMSLDMCLLVVSDEKPRTDNIEYMAGVSSTHLSESGRRDRPVQQRRSPLPRMVRFAVC
jgi:hypothetical protein